MGACLQSMEAVERYFTVAKRIALFLARTSSQHTIDHLVYEISRQISEDDDTAPAVSSDSGVSHVLFEARYLPLQYHPTCTFTFAGVSAAQHSSMLPRLLHRCLFLYKLCYLFMFEQATQISNVLLHAASQPDYLFHEDFWQGFYLGFCLFASLPPLFLHQIS